MTEKQKRLPPIITPAGTLAYPWLGKPDGKFNAEKPVYKTGFLLERTPDVENLLHQLDVAAETAVAEAKKANPKLQKQINKAAPYQDEVDDEGNETGKVKLNFKMNSFYVDKKTQKRVDMKPAVFDAKNKPIDPAVVKIGSGTQAKIAFRLVPYFNAATKSAGVSLQLVGVRVLELVEFGSAGGAGLFGVAEDGFEADDTHSSATPAGKDVEEGEAGTEGGEEF